MTSFVVSIFLNGLDLWKCTTPQTVLSSTGALGFFLNVLPLLGPDARVDGVNLLGWRMASQHQRPADTRLVHGKDYLIRPAQRGGSNAAAMVPT